MSDAPPPKEKKRRRPRGSGSLSLQKSGQWQARIAIGKNPDGSRAFLQAYGRTRKEADEKLHELRARVKDGRTEPSKESLAAFVNRWLEHVEGRVRKTTFSSYALTMNTYVLRDERLAGLPLAKVTPLEVEEFLRRLQGKFADRRKEGGTRTGAATRKMVFVCLKMALKKAVAWGLIPTNPLADGRVDAPKYKAAERPTWTLEEARRFLDAAKGDRLYGLFVLSLTCGLRHGELLGLRWCDVDLDGRVLHVRKSLPEVAGYVQPLEDPKTKAGVRDLPLTELAVAALKGRRELALAEGVAASEYVFPNLEGKPANKRMVYRAYEELISRSGVPKIVLHDQRHTFATLMRADGLDMKVLSKNLGHSQFALTADRYSHVLVSEQADVRESLGRVWGSTDPT